MLSIEHLFHPPGYPEYNDPPICCITSQKCAMLIMVEYGALSHKILDSIDRKYK